MSMKALILVGGYGTRLRPLTFSVPKPLVPFANEPILVHQLKALKSVGVSEVVLAVSYQPQVMMDVLKTVEKDLGLKITWSKEEVPLGTAGPIALGKKHLSDADLFFVLNSDVICQFPFHKMLEFHKKNQKEGTILITPVEDPTKYGVVVYKENDGEIEQFIEKPKVPVSNKINAGIYLFSNKNIKGSNKTVLSRIDDIQKGKEVPVSIEREIFPVMAQDKQLHAMVLPGYWMDIGQPKDYLRGVTLHLNSLDEKELKFDGPDVTIKGKVLIHKTAKIGKGCEIGPDVTIGENAVIEDGARISHSAILDKARVKKHALVKKSIIGWECLIGSWSRVEDSVLGMDVQVGDEVSLHGVQVCPHKGLKENELSSKIIM